MIDLTIEMGEVQNATLWILPDRFYVSNDVRPNNMLCIDRSSYQISLEMSNQQQIPMGCQRKPIVGIAGIIQFISGPHLVVVTKKEKVNTSFAFSYFAIC